VAQGEVVGIIGRNGAGKSTLLKILSRITTPTKGTVELHGRVGSLLEIGTGFHPEMTGRENIFLNGSILGMKNTEIEQKFDEIVKFSDTGKFIDTPVKRYSSGMYVRLAFAVAAHMETEILLVDEVLAVGDASFQKKCISKMGDIAKEGRTVLYVSHNMPSVMNLCSSVIFLQDGKKIMQGLPYDVIQQYRRSDHSNLCSVVWSTPEVAPGSNSIRLHSVNVLQQGIEGPTYDVVISKEINIELQYWNLVEGSRIFTVLHLFDIKDTFIFSTANIKYVSLTEDIWSNEPHPVGLFKSTMAIPGNFLNTGHYKMGVIIGTDKTEIHVRKDDVISFEVHDDGEMTKEIPGYWSGPVIRPKLAWETQRVS